MLLLLEIKLSFYISVIRRLKIIGITKTLSSIFTYYIIVQIIFLKVEMQTTNSPLNVFTVIVKWLTCWSDRSERHTPTLDT